MRSGDWRRPGARRSILLVFLCCGIASSVWASLVPFIKARLDLGEASLGATLLGFGGGAILAMPFNGALIQRMGSRNVVGLAGLVMAAALCALTVAPRPAAVAAVLLLGAAFGALDVAMNAQAVVLEASTGRPLMSSFHGLYSLGGLAGAAGISLLLRLGASASGCVWASSLLLAGVLLAQRGQLLPPDRDMRGSGATFALPRGRAAVLGAMCLGSFLAEGAVLDWGAVLLRFTRGFPAAWGGLGYAAFSVAMAAGRLFGDRLTRHVGPRLMLQSGATVAACGFLAVVAIPSGAVSLASFMLIGLGASNIVPVLLSAAGRLPGRPPAHSIASVGTLGYAGLLAGPAVIGGVAQATGLPLALGGVGFLLLGVAACAAAVAPPR